MSKKILKYLFSQMALSLEGVSGGQGRNYGIQNPKKTYLNKY